MNKNQEIETAFGRPASWWAAAPAVIVGCGAFLLAVYGTWIMPARLRPQYVSALEQAQSQYATLANSSSPLISWKIGEVAGELDVIYSRLIGLEGADAGRYWEWGEFLQQHAETVERKIQNPAASVQPDVRERLLDQSQQFQSKSRDIFEQLAAGKSELKAAAVVRVARTKYKLGLGEFGVRDAAALSAELHEMLDNSAITHPQLDDHELDEARLLQVQLMIEAAWQSSDGALLKVDTQLLRQAWEQFQNQPQTYAAGSAGELQWRSVGRLLAAMIGEELPDHAESPKFLAGDESADNAPQGTLNESTPTGWQSELAELQLAAVKGDWQQISFTLSRNQEQRPAAVLTGVARTICRLACSPMARSSSTWAEQSELGLLLVAQAAPHLPEFSELLWECARVQAGQAESTINLSASIPEMIARGQNVVLKHSVSALSSTLLHQPSVARTHLELIRRARGSLTLVARTALWRVQTMLPLSPPSENSEVGAAPQLTPEQVQELSQLSELMNSVTQLEPDNGLNWFTLGTLQFRVGNFDAMRPSLKRASELLGQVSAIDEMLEAAE